MRTHRKLTYHERDKIAYWYDVGERIREIARRLGRSPSSISDEIKRNKIGGRYHSIRAHQASEARKHNSHKKDVLKTRPTLQSYVVGKLGLGWSPEQIAGRLRKEINEGVRPAEEYINHESIYQYIYDTITIPSGCSLSRSGHCLKSAYQNQCFISCHMT